jgi:hypothetical protein
LFSGASSALLDPVLSLYTLSGKKVAFAKYCTVTSGDNTAHFYFTNLAAGTYVYEFRSANHKQLIGRISLAW